MWERDQASLNCEAKLKVPAAPAVFSMVVVLSIDCCTQDYVEVPGAPIGLGTAEALLIEIILELSLFHAWMLLLMQC